MRVALFMAPIAREENVINTRRKGMYTGTPPLFYKQRNTVCILTVSEDKR